MALRVSGKNIDLGEALRTKMVERITGVVAKFFSGTMSGHLTVTQEGTGFLTDCILHLSSGVDVQAHAMAYDAYLSADKVADIIEKRLRRYKQRLKDHAPPNGNSRIVEVPSYVIKSPEDEEDELEGTEFHPVVIAETKRNMKTIPVSEAVLELDMTGVSVLVFRHAGSGRVNLVYRRSDGNIGWVDPPTLDTSTCVIFKSMEIARDKLFGPCPALVIEPDKE